MNKPIYHQTCWECPECEWLNPYSGEVLLSNPPQTPYNCKNCNYKYNVIHYSEIDSFATKYPNGRPKVPSSSSTVKGDEKEC